MPTITLQDVDELRAQYRARRYLVSPARQGLLALGITAAKMLGGATALALGWVVPVAAFFAVAFATADAIGTSAAVVAGLAALVFVGNIAGMQLGRRIVRAAYRRAVDRADASLRLTSAIGGPSSAAAPTSPTPRRRVIGRATSTRALAAALLVVASASTAPPADRDPPYAWRAARITVLDENGQEGPGWAARECALAANAVARAGDGAAEVDAVVRVDPGLPVRASRMFVDVETTLPDGRRLRTSHDAPLSGGVGAPPARVPAHELGCFLLPLALSQARPPEASVSRVDVVRAACAKHAAELLRALR